MPDGFSRLLADIIIAFVGLDDGLEVGGKDTKVLNNFRAGEGGWAAAVR